MNKLSTTDLVKALRELRAESSDLSDLALRVIFELNMRGIRVKSQYRTSPLTGSEKGIY